MTASNETKVTRTLMRSLAVLECFAECDRDHGLSLTEVASRARIDKATALRLLTTFCVAGYLRRDETTHLYSLTAKVLQFTRGISWYQAIIEQSKPHLVRLCAEVVEVVHLGLLEEGRIIYIDKLEANQSVKLVSAVGQDMPLNTTALGKALMAYRVQAGASLDEFSDQFETRTSRSLTKKEELIREFERTRERGYSIDDNENQEGVICVGAPIFDRTAWPIAAISVSGPDFRMRKRLTEIGTKCRKIADAISMDLSA